MKASLIVPCWNSARTLARFLDCVRAQTRGDFEAIFVDDGSTDATPALLAAACAASRAWRLVPLAHAGVSAARNAGLAAATGEYVFFADPDDALRPDFIAAGVEAMERSGADYCVFPYNERFEDESEAHFVPLQGSCDYETNEAILARHFPRLFGYSFAQVRAWYAGAPLGAHRMQGGVCWCVYRRELIERHRVRFDERIALYEDAMFNCAYLLHAGRMAAGEGAHYDYLHDRAGAVARLRRGARELENKLELLRARQELDAASGGRLGALYEASCGFSALEMLKIVLTGRAPFFAGLRLVGRYLADATVRRAVAGFPLSWRHPLLASGLLALRLWCWLAGEPKADARR